MNRKISTALSVFLIVIFAALVGALSLFAIKGTYLADTVSETKIVKTENKSESPQKEEISQKDWLEFKNYQYNYQVKYPKDWKVSAKKLDKIELSSTVSGAPISLEISVSPVSEKLDIDALLGKALLDEIAGGRTISKKETEVAGIKGYEVSHCGKFECVTQKWAVVSDGNFYFLNGKNAATPIFDQIVSTFKFIK